MSVRRTRTPECLEEWTRVLWSEVRCCPSDSDDTFSSFSPVSGPLLLRVLPPLPRVVSGPREGDSRRRGMRIRVVTTPGSPLRVPLTPFTYSVVHSCHRDLPSTLHVPRPPFLGVGPLPLWDLYKEGHRRGVVEDPPCHHLPPLATTYHHLSPLATTCHSPYTWVGDSLEDLDR